MNLVKLTIEGLNKENQCQHQMGQLREYYINATLEGQEKINQILIALIIFKHACKLLKPQQEIKASLEHIENKSLSRN